MAPQVQTLDQVMAELAPSYQGQTDLIAKQQAGLGAKYGAQRDALDAQKGQGFNTINTNAVAKGRAYGGLPVHEQAQYLSTQYLPGMQRANEAQNEEDLKLQGQALALQAEQRNKALDTIEKQRSSLNEWNMQQARIDAEAKQAAAAAGGGAPKGILNTVSNLLNSKRGRDTFVSPETYREARRLWLEAGGTPDEFNQTYSAYINPTHQKLFGGYY